MAYWVHDRVWLRAALHGSVVAPGRVRLLLQR